MPQPTQPRSFGAPMGPQAAAPGAQRNVAQQPSAQQIHQALAQREAQLQQEMQRIQRLKAHMNGERPAVRGSSGGFAGQMQIGKGLRGKQLQGQLKKMGE